MASTRSSYILLSAAVLLSLLAAAAARTNWCEPGLVIPLNPLPSCRTYMVRRACGVSSVPSVVPVPVLKERCCAELEKIVPYCRCSALRTALDGMMTGYAMKPTCSWGGLLQFAPTLVSERECNLKTIHGRPFCYALEAEGTTTD